MRITASAAQGLNVQAKRTRRNALHRKSQKAASRFHGGL